MSIRLTHAQRNARRKAITETRRIYAKMNANAGYKCPKCGETSGNDWSQCNKSCPISASPHYDVVAYPLAKAA